MADDYGKIIEQALRDGDEERVVEALAEEFDPRLGDVLEEARRRLADEEGGGPSNNVIPLPRREKGE